MQERIRYIDSLRGLAVVFMVQQHILFWTWEKHWLSFSLTFPEHPVMLSLNFCGNFAAPLFILLAGVGSSFLSDKTGFLRYEHLKRGIFVVLCGYLLNCISPHWLKPGSWFVLHTTGFAIILSPVFLKMKNIQLIFSGIAFICISALLQTWLKTPLIAGNDFMNDLGRSFCIFRLILAEGHFPLFPWLAFFTTGIVCSRWIDNGRYNNIIKLAGSSFIIGFILAFCYENGFFFATGGKFFRFFVFVFPVYPPHPPLIFMLIAVSLFLLFVFITFIKERVSLPIKALEVLGRTSFSWFFIHIIIFNEIFHLAGLYKIFSSGWSVLIIVIFLVFIIIISLKWEKLNYRFGLEWLMRKL